MNNPFTFFLKLSVIPILILLFLYVYFSFNKVDVEIVPIQTSSKEVGIGKSFLYGFGENPDWELNLVRKENFAEVLLGDKKKDIVFNGYVNYESLTEDAFVYQGGTKNNKSTSTDVVTIELIPVKCFTQSKVEGEFVIKVLVGDSHKYGGCANGLKM